MGQQPEILEHHAHLVAPELDELALRDLEEVFTVQDHRAGGGFNEAREAADDGGLARAREAHDDEDLALGHIESNIARGRNVVLGAKCLNQALPVLRVAGQLRPIQQPIDIGPVDFPQIAARKNRGPCSSWARRRLVHGHDTTTLRRMGRVRHPARPIILASQRYGLGLAQPPAMAASTQGRQISSLSSTHVLVTFSRSSPFTSTAIISDSCTSFVIL